MPCLIALGRPVQEIVHIDVDPEQIIRRLAKRQELEGRVDDAEITVRKPYAGICGTDCTGGGLL